MAKVKPGKDKGARKSVTTVKGSEEWADWLGRFAEFRRVSVMSLIDMSLASHAKETGFEPPPRR